MDDRGSPLMRALDVYNGRVSAATGTGPGEHAVSSPKQWALTFTGLDVDQDELVALGCTLADMMTATVQRMPDEAEAVLVDGLRQMFAIGALHEQERARREAAGE